MDTQGPTSHRFWIALTVLSCLVLAGCPKDKSNDRPADSNTSGENRSAQGAGDAATPATQTPAANKADADAALANLKKYHYADVYLSASVDAEITESGKKSYTYDIRIDNRFGSHSSASPSTRKGEPFRVTWEGNTFRVQGTHQAGSEHFTTQETVNIHGEVDPAPIATQSNPTPAKLLWVQGTLSSKTVQGNQSRQIELTIESGPVPFESYYVGPPKSCVFKDDGAAEAKRTITYTQTDTDTVVQDGKETVETTTRKFAGALGASGELSVSFYHIPNWGTGKGRPSDGQPAGLNAAANPISIFISYLTAPYIATAGISELQPS